MIMYKDPQIESLIQKELIRQTEGIELIASEKELQVKVN